MDNLTTIQIVTWIITVLCGGLMGAVVKTLVDEWKGRRQPVGFRTEVDIIGGPTPPDAGLHAQVAILYNGAAYDLTNLSVIRVELVNNGNKDLGSFTVGVEMAEGQPCLFAEAKGEDHHHAMTLKDPRPTQINVETRWTSFANHSTEVMSTG